MRKRILLTAALMLATVAAMCAGLTACGESSGDEVSEKEWKATLSEGDFDNCKMVMRTNSIGDGPETYVTMTFILDGDKTYLTVEERYAEGDTGIDEYYIVAQNGGSVTYERDGDIWVESLYNDMGEMLTGVTGAFKIYAGMYSVFSYDQEDGVYRYTASSAYGDAAYELGFQNGKPVRYAMVSSTINQEWTITYGGQKVELPFTLEEIA